MTTVEQIATRIGGCAPVRAIGGDRWFKAQAPEDVRKQFDHHVARRTGMPFVVWLETETDEFRHLRGPTGIAMARLEIEVFGEPHGLTDDLVTQIRLVSHGRTAIVKGKRVNEMTITSTSRNVIRPSDGSEVGVYNVSIDLEIWFERSTVAAATI